MYPLAYARVWAHNAYISTDNEVSTHVGQPSIARSRSQRSIVSQAAESSSLADHQTRFDGRNKQALNEVLHDSNVVLHGYPQYACTQS